MNALGPGPAKRVTVYFEEGETFEGRSLLSVIVDLLKDHRVRGATVLRGIGGFGNDGVMHSAKLLSMTESLPVKIEFIESYEKIDEIIPHLKNVISKGVIDVSDTTIVHVC